MNVSTCRSTSSDACVSRSAASEHPSDLATRTSVGSSLLRAPLPGSSDLRPIDHRRSLRLSRPGLTSADRDVARRAPRVERPRGGKGETSGMETPRVSISTGARGRGVCLRVVVVVFAIVLFPAAGRALNARLRWTASPDSRVQGYNVYVREATKPHGAPRNAGAPHVEGDGSAWWGLTGLTARTTYFVAVTAYIGTGLESTLSNELPIGTPNPCVRDECTAPTQCILQSLADGTSCGPPGAACGATCLAGVCAGLADRVMTVDRLRVKTVRGDLNILAKGNFVTSAPFSPLTPTPH